MADGVGEVYVLVDYLFLAAWVEVPGTGSRSAKPCR